MDIERWREDVRAFYLTMARAPRDRLRWITVILAVRVVRLSDDPSAEVARMIEEFRSEWRSCAMQSGRIKRGTRWAGVVEVDLAHPNLLGGAAKRDLIHQLGGVDPGTLDVQRDRVIVVHLHAVVDFKGHDTPDEFAADARRHWPGPRRVHVAHIWEGSVAEQLDRLASYSCKRRDRYSMAWEGKRTQFFLPHEHPWRAWMIRLHDRVGLANMVVANVKSRASRCPLEDPVPRGNSGSGERPQLISGEHGQDEEVSSPPTYEQLPTLSQEPLSNSSPTLGEDHEIYMQEEPARPDPPGALLLSPDPAMAEGPACNGRERDRQPDGAYPASGTRPAGRSRDLGYGNGEAVVARAGSEAGRARPRTPGADQDDPGVRDAPHHRHREEARPLTAARQEPRRELTCTRTFHTRGPPRARKVLKLLMVRVGGESSILPSGTIPARCRTGALPVRTSPAGSHGL